MLAITEPQRQWFVLLTEPQMERKAAAHLIGRRFKTYLPEEAVWARRGVRRQKVEVRRPIFRGYLFIHLSFEADADRWNKVTTVPGIHRFMRLNDDFAIVPDHEMHKLFATEQILLQPAKIRGPASIFKAGEQVRATEGPFSGFAGEIERLDDEQRISVLMAMFGRVTRVHFQAEQLEKL